MEFYLTDGSNGAKPVPERKRKLVTNALEEHEEYLKMKNVILSGRMKPLQTAVIKMGPTDAEKLGYKWPWRTAVDSLRRLVKSMGMEADYTIRKYETSTPGVWAILATYEPPIAATGRPEATQHAAAPRRSRRTA